MSNLIKYPFVNMQGKQSVVINNNADGEFVPFRDKRVKIKTISEIEAEKALLHATESVVEEDPEVAATREQEGAGEFKEGIKVSNFDELFQKHKKQAESSADRILEKARAQAELILSESESAAEKARSRGYEEGKEQGYLEGIVQAEQEIQRREEELNDYARRQRDELAECVSQLEGKYVNVLISLIKKLTGVVVEGKDDLILYLIQTAVNDLDLSDNYKIRVSSDDIYYLENKKEEITDQIGENVVIEFLEEKGLEKGQCIIETDTQMVDCGLQTQIDTLVQDLKMLVR